MQKLLINGVKTNRIPATDRGLQYGDGLYETIAVKEGNPCLWKQHLQRLLSGCARLGIPEPDVGQLQEEVAQEIGSKRQAVIKVIITRGKGDRGYRAPEKPVPRRIVQSSHWPEYPLNVMEQGVQIQICSTRLSCNPVLSGIKHLNRLEQVLARSEWDDPNISEGLMLDLSGHVIEGTMSNLFLISKGCLITPNLDKCGIQGIMRDLVIDVARSRKIPIEIREITLKDLHTAQLLFLTNSIIGIWPVNELWGRVYDLGELRRAFVDEVMERGFNA